MMTPDYMTPPASTLPHFSLYSYDKNTNSAGQCDEGLDDTP
jgi:hypothetical protein